MSNETLEELIQQLNLKEPKELMFTKPLAPSVDLIKVWSNNARPTVLTIWPDRENTIYFIKNKDSVYVGAVYDMENNLHWYVLPEHRKQGHLTSALREVIVPYLFQHYEELRISITCGNHLSTDSEKVALNVGFRKINTIGGNDRYLLKSADFKQAPPSDLNEKVPLSEQRYMELKSQVEDLARSLKILKSELEIYADSSVYDYKELDSLAAALKGYAHAELKKIWKISNHRPRRTGL